MAQEYNLTHDRSDIEIREPSKYTVILHNDDFTTMDFVVEILVTIFFKPLKVAEQIMLQVHNSGKARVGEYSLDIALSKVGKVTELARANGFPLKLSIQEI